MHTSWWFQSIRKMSDWIISLSRVKTENAWKHYLGPSILPLMEEILHHLGCIKPWKYWDNLPLNWCRISSHQQHYTSKYPPSELHYFFCEPGVPRQLSASGMPAAIPSAAAAIDDQDLQSKSMILAKKKNKLLLAPIYAIRNRLIFRFHGGNLPFNCFNSQQK